MEIRSWAAKNGIKVLNDAGPRGSRDPEIYEATKKLLTLLIKRFIRQMPGSLHE
jgi:hypothetical protein